MNYLVRMVIVQLCNLL